MTDTRIGCRDGTRILLVGEYTNTVDVTPICQKVGTVVSASVDVKKVKFVKESRTERRKREREQLKKK